MALLNKELWMKRIHRFLREEATVETVWMPDATGSYSDDTQHIRVNPFLEFVRILIHEAIHGIAPDLSEEEVLQKEDQLVEALSERQILYLINQYMVMCNGNQIAYRRTEFADD